MCIVISEALKRYLAVSTHSMNVFFEMLQLAMINKFTIVFLRLFEVGLHVKAMSPEIK